ncbi:MAG: hypothetical protein RLZZ352_1496 [Pseudomonadota bacterium]
MPSLMNGLMNVVGRLLGAVLKLTVWLAVSALVLSLLLLALLLVLGSSLWALLRGRKPTPVLMFQQFRQASQRYTGGSWAGRAGRRGADDVVDVQAHEVPESPPASARAHPGSVVRLP